MYKTHFISRIKDTMQKSFTESAEVFRLYDEELYALQKDTEHNADWRRAECERVYRERRAYAGNRSAKLKEQVQAILDEETADVTAALTIRTATVDELNTLSALRSSTSLTAKEFSVFAEPLKGCYWAEKMLADIASAHGFPYTFVPLDQQLARIGIFGEKILAACHYTGEASNRTWNHVICGGGDGIPYYAQYFFKFTDEIIDEYENGAFKVQEIIRIPTPAEQIKNLSEKYPAAAYKINAFIKQNEQSLAEELFASRVQEFINEIVEEYDE